MRAVLDLLAVVERPLPLADLAALTGLPAERLDPVLATLIAGRAVAGSNPPTPPFAMPTTKPRTPTRSLSSSSPNASSSKPPMPATSSGSPPLSAPGNSPPKPRPNSTAAATPPPRNPMTTPGLKIWPSAPVSCACRSPKRLAVSPRSARHGPSTAAGSSVNSRLSQSQSKGLRHSTTRKLNCKATGADATVPGCGLSLAESAGGRDQPKWSRRENNGPLRPAMVLSCCVLEAGPGLQVEVLSG